jgi:hypothetical protein
VPEAVFLSLGGNIVPVENLAESLQVAFDAGAKRLLLPMASVDVTLNLNVEVRDHGRCGHRHGNAAGDRLGVGGGERRGFGRREGHPREDVFALIAGHEGIGGGQAAGSEVGAGERDRAGVAANLMVGSVQSFHLDGGGDGCLDVVGRFDREMRNGTRNDSGMKAARHGSVFQHRKSGLIGSGSGRRLTTAKQASEPT